MKPVILFVLFILPLIHAKTVPLPQDVQPIGVAHAAGTNFFTGNIRTGAVYLVDVESGYTTTAVKSAPNRTAIGMYALDSRLFVAGGGALRVGSSPGLPIPSLHVYDVITGNNIASCLVDGGFVYDVFADCFHAFYTDSSRGVVYKLSLSDLQRCTVETIRLPPPFFDSQGILNISTATGIVKYKGGLIISNSHLNTIFFVDLLNDNNMQQLLPSGSVPGADGLDIRLREGGYFLYVTQNVRNLASAWKLSIDNRKVSAAFVKDIILPGASYPTTIAVSEKKIVAANGKVKEVSPFERIPANVTLSLIAIDIDLAEGICAF